MIVNRTIYINPVEPEFVSFRMLQGVDNKIDFHFMRQTGAPWNEDIVAQLQLTARSNDQTQFFSVPATDISNGRARAVIPAGLVHDPNGWRMRLSATVNQEPRIIAYGIVTTLEGAGPQLEPQDVIDSIDLQFYYDNPVTFIVKVWHDEGKHSPYDLAAASVAGNVYNQQGGFAIMPFTVTDTDATANTVTMSLTMDQVNTLPAACWWSMTIASGAGVTTIAEGRVTVGTVVAS
jgi:hypothetical protein